MNSAPAAPSGTQGGRRGILATIGLFFTDRDRIEPAMVTLLAVIFSLLGGVALIFIVSKHPAQSATNFLLAPLLRSYNFYYLLIVMVPLTFAGLALCIVYQAGYLSLIVDSSLYMGAVVATAVGIFLPLPRGLHPAVAMLAAGTVGGLIGLLPAVLKIKWRANELVSSLMFNYIFYFLGSCVIIYFLRDQKQSILSSLPFRASFELPKLVANTQLHAGFIVAAVFVVLVSLFIYRTKWGFEIRVIGANPRFASYAGLSVSAIALYAHFISGFIAGVGGAVEMAGLYTAFIWQMDPSYAWDGVIVAMLARRNPKFVPLSAFFLAWMRVGADFMSRRGDVAVEFITLLQGFIILILASNRIVSWFKVRRLRAEALRATHAAALAAPSASAPAASGGPGL
jgi:simple sugar transport system permease protein